MMESQPSPALPKPTKRPYQVRLTDPLKDWVEYERDKGEQGQNPDPLTDLLEEIRRKR